MKKNTLLIIVDMQNDFCMPEGPLNVPGAMEDTERLARFISWNVNRIDHIILTQDNHHVIDISHPVFWAGRDGNPPSAFTKINRRDIEKGVWRAVFEVRRAHEYINRLEEQGEFPHTIWPEHCIIGSKGAAVVDEIMEPLKKWARKGNFYEVVVKGTNPLTEHFGALRANIVYDDSPETQINRLLVERMKSFSTILIAGEARSHCVANTIRQALEIEGIAEKLVILEDCMSDVPGFSTIALPIYREAEKSGVRFTSSGKYRFDQ